MLTGLAPDVHDKLESDAFPSSSANTLITIQVNFTQLGPGTQIVNSQATEIEGAVKLMVGMADRPEDIMEDAIPFLLFPNLSLISTMSLSLRSKVKNFALRLIGWQQVCFFQLITCSRKLTRGRPKVLHIPSCTY
jgi:hypothetical protein